MKTEFLKGLELSDEVIAKIQAESGKDVQKAKSNYEDLQTEIKNLTEQLNQAKTTISELEQSTGNIDELQNQINAYKKSEEERSIKEQETQKQRNFDQRFNTFAEINEWINDYTKNGVKEQFIEEISKNDNAGKSDEEIYKSLIKDQNFFKSANPQVNISGVKKEINTTLSKEQFGKMNYRERAKLYENDRSTYEALAKGE